MDDLPGGVVFLLGALSGAGLVGLLAGVLLARRYPPNRRR